MFCWASADAVHRRLITAAAHLDLIACLVPLLLPAALFDWMQAAMAKYENDAEVMGVLDALQARLEQQEGGGDARQATIDV
jgi:hypothetical protein